MKRFLCLLVCVCLGHRWEVRRRYPDQLTALFGPTDESIWVERCKCCGETHDIQQQKQNQKGNQQP